MSNRSIAGAALALLFLDGPALCVTKPFEKVSTTVNNATTFPRGVRNIGMGGAGVADISGFSTGYFNPASFAWSDAVTFGASTSGWMDVLHYADARLSAGYPLKGTVLGAALRLGGSIAYSDASMDLRCGGTIYVPEGTAASCETDNHDRYVSGSLAARAKKGIWELGLGGTAKYIDVKGAGQYTAWAFDLGFVAAADIERAAGSGLRPRVGASVRNLGEDIHYSTIGVEQPGEYRYGGGLDVFTRPVASVTERLHRRVPAVGVSFDYDVVKGDGTNHADGWAFGAETSFFRMVSLRAGWSKDAFFSTDCTTYGIGLGWDFGRLLFQLDYARIDPSCDLCGLLGIHPEHDAFGLVVGGRF